MLVAHVLGAEPGMTVIDACAAPGGKTTHIAQRMENRGRIWAFDIHEEKLRRSLSRGSRADAKRIKTGAPGCATFYAVKACLYGI